MRTKTVLLSALLAGIGSVSVMAQTNVYSLNAVGYINETLYPGFNIISCPLICTDPSGAVDNTITNILPNTNGQFKTWKIYGWNGAYITDIGNSATWAGTTQSLNPGQAVWIQNPSNSPVTVTFVGTVPTGPITNVINPGFNLISSAVPASGDIVTNTIMDFGTNAFKTDKVYTYNPVTTNYTTYIAGANGLWPGGHPQLPTVGGGFWYENNTSTGTTNYWVENYSVSNP
jgi:hypothetical protein